MSVQLHLRWGANKEKLTTWKRVPASSCVTEGQYRTESTGCGPMYILTLLGQWLASVMHHKTWHLRRTISCSTTMIRLITGIDWIIIEPMRFSWINTQNVLPNLWVWLKHTMKSKIQPFFYSGLSKVDGIQKEHFEWLFKWPMQEDLHYSLKEDRISEFEYFSIQRIYGIWPHE